MQERHDTVIVGGGQAGLAMSYWLRQHGREHIILERKRIAERWRSERWNSLAFQFTNEYLRLPGYAYQGSDPDGFAHHSAITRFIEDYARFIDAPVRCSSEVMDIRQESDSDRMVIRTRETTITASQVVIATGPFQRPMIPSWSEAFPPNVFQVHATHYTHPDQLPPGAVLVIGSGASGCQIAEELYQCGRTVYLSTSRHRRMPRRYRGKDILWWLLAMGRMDTNIDSFPDRKIPPSIVITGVGGGHDINLRRFAAEGVVILGRLHGVQDGRAMFGNNAEAILAAADQAYMQFKLDADKFVASTGVSLPAEENETPVADPLPTCSILDMKSANITAVVWCTGHAYDFDWVKLPVFDQRAIPIQQRGVTPCKHLFFLGLHWMHTFKSATFFGVGEDASYLSDQISMCST